MSIIALYSDPLTLLDSDSSASSSEASEPQIISSRKVKQATIRKKVTLKVKRHVSHIRYARLVFPTIQEHASM